MLTTKPVMIPFWFSDAGRFQLRCIEVELSGKPSKLVGGPLGTVNKRIYIY